VSGDLTTEWLDTLDRVSANEWDSLADGDAFYLVSGWLRRLEEKTDRTVRYAVVRRAGALVAALPIYEVRAEAGSYDPARLAKLTLLPEPILLAGACRGQRNQLLLAEGLAEPHARDAVSMLVSAALDLAAERNARGVVFPFLTGRSLDRLASAVPVRAAFDDVDMEISGLGRGLPGYLDALSVARRRGIERELRLFAAAGWRVDEQRLGDCWAELAGLFFQVQAKYGHRASIERYRALLRRQAELLDDRSVVFVVREADGRLVAAMLSYRWRDCLYVRLVGFDYARLRGAMEYFNVTYYEPIRFAGRHGLARLHLGPASHEAKILRGAQLSPLWTAAVPVAGTDHLLLDWPAARAETFRRFAAHPLALPPERWETPPAFGLDGR
jgi:predicted N-acyltransferase